MQKVLLILLKVFFFIGSYGIPNRSELHRIKSHSNKIPDLLSLLSDAVHFAQPLPAAWVSCILYFPGLAVKLPILFWIGGTGLFFSQLPFAYRKLSGTEQRFYPYCRVNAVQHLFFCRGENSTKKKWPKYKEYQRPFKEHNILYKFIVRKCIIVYAPDKNIADLTYTDCSNSYRWRL